jgi:hypothetical protein
VAPDAPCLTYRPVSRGRMGRESGRRIALTTGDLRTRGDSRCALRRRPLLTPAAVLTYSTHR